MLETWGAVANEGPRAPHFASQGGPELRLSARCRFREDDASRLLDEIADI